MIAASIGVDPSRMGNFGGDISTRLIGLAMRALREHDVSMALTSLQPGWNQAFATACIMLDIPYIAALPYDVSTENMTEDERDVFRAQLRQARSVIPIHVQCAMCPDEQLQCWLIDTADIVIALWNGEPGCTADCVSMSHLKGKAVFNVWDDFAAQG